MLNGTFKFESMDVVNPENLIAGCKRSAIANNKVYIFNGTDRFVAGGNIKGNYLLLRRTLHMIWRDPNFYA